ncbi:PREDICTED: uncharacterized protein LOC108787524 isoform X2 [Nanorana parkeri]|uniref:uncharacterized protein LOC108787524 isoform X2 n=1 Tax=Nanorana parkeri TaxID=125878 RepID=UPI000853F545|nr:PREDICTED: uncharacterized protein LOC108787524 isoform X2 [Nanorana parkeri]
MCFVVELQHIYSNPLKGVAVETKEASETIEESVEAGIVEAAAEEVTEQEAIPATPLEQEQPLTEEESSASPLEEEPAASPEASTEQDLVEQENTEPVVEAVAAETSPVLEASSDNIPVELASAAEDWSEFSARKPEESVEENLSVAEESEEAVESGAAAASS